MLKTIVDDYIDLDKLINSLDIWNNNIFLQLKTDHVSMCDTKTPINHIKTINNFIKTFEKPMFYMHDVCCCHANINGRNILFKLYTFENKHMFFIVIKQQYHYFSMVGLIDSYNDKFLFVGVENSHSFYVSENISYGNSDGSTSNIEIDYEIDCETIYSFAQNYFNDFANDKYH